MSQKNAYQKPTFLIPNNNIDMHKWAVIACDQFTSQPEYWQQVEELVNDAPSTYRMILPEAYLETPRAEEHAQNTYQAMQTYVSQGVFHEQTGFVFIERDLGEKTRYGLLLNLDLEQYDFHKGSQSMIRATEGTILDRLPPRIKIREKALLELPHIMILIDDRDDELFSYLEQHKDSYQTIYDFELMQDSGSIRGSIIDEAGESKIRDVFEKLCDQSEFQEKYGLDETTSPLLFAVGDGNHSLATAKSIWDKIKDSVPADHPARYALVEVVNIHDSSLVFEPIHRVLFQCQPDLVQVMKKAFGADLTVKEMPDYESLCEHVHQVCEVQQTGLVQDGKYYLLQFTNPSSTLPVGTLQKYLDEYLKTNSTVTLDYVHGDDVLLDLSNKEGNAGFLLPAMQKNDLFRTVILDGSLPRKTFSMGDAREKRFYLECRKIQ